MLDTMCFLQETVSSQVESNWCHVNLPPRTNGDLSLIYILSISSLDLWHTGLHIYITKKSNQIRTKAKAALYDFTELQFSS